MAIRIGSSATRRRFMATSAAATALTTIGGIFRPFISRANDRPLITHGLQSGDVSADSGVVWARADRPSRMLVEIATTDSFKDARNVAFVDALPESDFTAKLLLENLPPAQDIFYRVRFQDLASPTVAGEPRVGRFRTAPNDRRSVKFRVVRRHRRTGLGHRRVARRHADLCDHAEASAGLFHPQR